MSRVWLCQYPVAKHPLKVKTGVNLYSFEELCYYLYQNAEAVEESFYNEILCQWLEQEIRNQELARRLSEGLQEEQGGCWFIEQILKDGGLQDSQEIEQAVHLAKSMENKSPAQCAKLRGDRFLQSGRYRDALWEYRSALEEETDVFFQGRIWHNLGTLYARQFLFTAAAECYKRAYETGQQTESSEAYLLALSCRDHQVSPQEEEDVEEVLSRLKLMKKSGNRAGYEEKIEEMLLRLRTEYRKSE
ncbi:MAG: hypothetical protein HFI69_04665 [Lachnospiraceae bacterium]|jgi:tetratricopeptide (TPR) repeat protein|nr:hypothetical protein [Lachnospiraceae bacterium]